jgi:DNA-binding IclR family transcriptional regulator
VAEVSSESERGYRVPAVERTFRILRVLAERAPASLAEVVECTDVNKSTVFYILRTLSGLDVVSYDDATRTYALGPALMELGLTASGQINDVSVAKRNLAELLESFDVTLVLYRRVSVGEIMMVDKLERAHRVRITLQPGIRVPIQGGSFGRVFLAFDEETAVDEALTGGMHQFTPKSVSSVAEFRREIQVVRERGWAVDHEGFALGVSTVAAPIFGAGGDVTLVAAAVGFTGVMTDEIAARCGQELRALCHRISRLLGANGMP